MRLISLLILLPCFLISIEGQIHNGGSFYNDLGAFFSKDGFNFLTLTGTDEHEISKNEARLAFTAFQKQGLRVQGLNSNKMLSQTQFNLDTLVIFTKTRIVKELDKFQLVLENISKHKIRKSVLLFIDKFSPSE